MTEPADDPRPEPPTPTPSRRRWTIRGLMLLVVSVAVYAAMFAHVRAWGERRELMYAQRDATKAILEEARLVIAEAGRQASDFRVVDRPDGATPTAEWTLRLEAWEDHDGRPAPLIRATVSGANSRFSSSLSPILVETHGSPLDAPWLDRLRQYYDAREWRYEFIRRETEEPPTSDLAP